MSYTKVSKLYFYKCAHFLLVLSLSIVITRQFHSFSKSLTLISLIPTLIPRITIIPPSRSGFPIPAFTDFISGKIKCFISVSGQFLMTVYMMKPEINLIYFILFKVDKFKDK